MANDILGNVATFAALVCPLFIWIFILVDIFRNEFSECHKAAWLLVTVFVPPLGLLQYMSLRNKHGIEVGSWMASANLAGLITVPVAAATVIMYRFLLGQDLP